MRDAWRAGGRACVGCVAGQHMVIWLSLYSDNVAGYPPTVPSNRNKSVWLARNPNNSNSVIAAARRAHMIGRDRPSPRRDQRAVILVLGAGIGPVDREIIKSGRSSQLVQPTMDNAQGSMMLASSKGSNECISKECLRPRASSIQASPWARPPSRPCPPRAPPIAPP